MNIFNLIPVLLIGFVFCSCTFTENSENHEAGNISQVRTTDSVESLESLNLLIENNPQNVSAYLKRAGHFIAKEEYDLAISDLNSVIGIDSVQIDAYSYFADIYLKLNNPGKSAEYLKKCITINPKSTNALINLAKLYFYAKQYPIAIACLDTALRIDPSDHYPYFLKGLIYKETGNTVKAKISFHTSVERNPDFFDGYMELGLINIHQNPDLATEFLNTALRIDSTSVEAYYARALCFQNNKELEKAKDDYRKIIRINPSYANAYYNLGYIYYYTDSILQACNYFDTTITFDSLYPEAYYNRGLCYELMNEKQKALQDFRRAISLKPGFELARNKLRN